MTLSEYEQAQRREAVAAWRRVKNLTRRRTVAAIAAGILTRQPCEMCGAAEVQAHHDDYTKPLDVAWLCVRCHHRHHNWLRRQEEQISGAAWKALRASRAALGWAYDAARVG